MVDNRVVPLKGHLMEYFVIDDVTYILKGIFNFVGMLFDFS
ncbi:hypothetical protein J6TS1_18030 [Siminovitchia terrae]|uniref:Uncharacterized protein n=1 Tax=Siminovitchia terrae TaxID=1914933 RepID=A0ABQ4KV65_SIMTE|nr:hypothetical protein J6TS1_18030 [Siminovitchia terrae]